MPHIRKIRHVCMVLCLCLSISLSPAARAVDLLQSYQAALTQDASYAASRAAAEAGQEALPQALAQLMPNVSANTSRYKVHLESTVPNVFGRMTTTETNYPSSEYTLSLRQPLYRKYQFEQYQQAKSQVLAADTGLEKDRQDLGVRVSGAYLDALLAQDQLSLLEAQKTAYAGQLEGAKRSFLAGVGTRTDIDEAQARYDLIAAQELEARRNIEITRRTLRSIINQPVTSLALLDPAKLQLDPPNPVDPEVWIARGETASPELRNLQAQVDAARQEVEKTQAGHYPTVDLVATLDRSQSANVYSVNTLYRSAQIGIQITIPLFSGGYVNSTVRQAEASLDKVRQQYEAARRNLSVNIQKEFDGMTEGIAKVRAREQAMRSAEQALYSTRKGVQAGTRTQLDVLDAEQQKVNAMRNLAQERYLYIMARIRLMGLTGALDEDEIATINRWFSGSSKSSRVQSLL